MTDPINCEWYYLKNGTEVVTSGRNLKISPFTLEGGKTHLVTARAWYGTACITMRRGMGALRHAIMSLFVIVISYLSCVGNSSCVM